MHKIRNAAVVIAFTALSGSMLALSAPPATAKELGGVDMQAACNNQYKGWGTTAVVLDPKSAYSWRCKPKVGIAQPINVNQQCTVQYGSPAFSKARDPKNPYTWYCFNNK
ncbi:hypothetical protein [Skermania piniformis]|uniref:Secreted protein n=1 Tax=Skermania pinensis TaxID=39122 RepID=A0ABX8SAH8_9ACTN|nr:hypothetical protein [Skermania piniformis]QXQ14316.1 hypothetical protein KV203_02475 [Skermania piniformis]